MIAYAWASGLIEFGRGNRCPRGAITIARGEAKILRTVVTGWARHGYEPGVLLVPGVPEGGGIGALTKFSKQVNASIKKRTCSESK